MWRRLILVNVALCAIGFSVTRGFTATCTPLANGKCKACKNCKYCNYCAVIGGKCSVCSRGK